MQTTEHSKETVEEAMRLLAAYQGNVSKVSRHMGIARSVITSWRDGTRRGADAGTAVAVTGVTPPARTDVSQEPGVTRASRLVQKWDRSTNKSLDIVNRRLDQLDQKLKKGGSVTTDDVRGLKETAWVAAVGTDKISVLSGGATARTEHQIKVSFGPADPLDGKTFVDRPNTIEGEWKLLGDGSMVNGDYAYVPDRSDLPGTTMLVGNPLLRIAARVIEDEENVPGAEVLAEDISEPTEQARHP